jgi:DtxR family Mn-dependent transcriptional regulator
LIALIVGLALVGAVLLLFWPKGGLIGYLRRVQQMSDRVLREDALKQIHKSERHDQPQTLEALAGALQISVNKAAGLAADLQQDELLEVRGDKLHLTAVGRRSALQIIRAHRLWERYLANETGYDEQEWHDQADRLEHMLAPEAAEALDNRLGRPTHDPHGDPIPTAEGELVLHGGKPLTSMQLNEPLRIVHIEDEPEVVFAQLMAEGLYPGMQVRLLEQSSQRVRFWANGDEHLLAPIVAANISVVPAAQETQVVVEGAFPLSKLLPGQSASVLALSPRLRGAERRRMMDLGVLPGTKITAEMTAPGGQPTAYRIRGALIALREDQANLIQITKSLEPVR